jgi:hypothetical protein
MLYGLIAENNSITKSPLKIQEKPRGEEKLRVCKISVLPV